MSEATSIENATDTTELSPYQSSEYLSFQLANELYGIEINYIEEIRVWEAPTPIPRAPDFVKGVINLRGMIVPILDLREWFHIGVCSYHPCTVVLILRCHDEGKQQLMGIVVDSVSDVVSQNSNEIYPAVGDSEIIAYISGLLNVGEQIMSLLDIAELTNIKHILQRY